MKVVNETLRFADGWNYSTGAEFSHDGKYRYRLWRTWGPGRRILCWVMLNPSSADEHDDDNTLRRCTTFARAWKYDGLEVVNLYALISTDPRGLAGTTDPVGPQNDRAIQQAVARAATLVAAWGACSFVTLQRVKAVHDGCVWPRETMCLGYTQDGSPKHPLRLAKSTGLVPYHWP